MLCRRINPRIVTLLAYALAVHALVWSFGAGHQALAAHVWCGKANASAPLIEPQGPATQGELEACQIACGASAPVAVVAQSVAHPPLNGMLAADAAATFTPATAHRPGMPRAPPR